MDEQWSFVGHKKQRHWLWYAFWREEQFVTHVQWKSTKNLLAHIIY
ncbi:protein of unknown function [Xenorhabdus poinarii G6]|uniref:Transposase n=1 Tax=Xenorhabdus poinarii G6 TaxID=1354304 RepID=A0A068R574_9GAMM|nr:protein of unknown function [Xenorhabdus poinarii G6]